MKTGTVILRCAQNLALAQGRFFAALRMTELERSRLVKFMGAEDRG